MGNKATKDSVAADMAPPNYRAAVQRLRTIKAKKDKIGGVNGEIADIYAKVEGHKVNRKAAKIWVVLDNLEPAERLDVMRSLDGLADAAGWEETASDLVDAAEGNVVPMRMTQRKPAGEESEDDEPSRDTAADIANAFIEKARGHLGSRGKSVDEDAGDDDGDR